MTEAEWLTCLDPMVMLLGLRRGMREHATEPFLSCGPNNNKPSERKLTLFACACCRQIWPLLTARSGRHAVLVAEQFADGKKSLAYASLACHHAIEAGLTSTVGMAPAYLVPLDLAQVFSNEGKRRNFPDEINHADLLRDMVGNPWRPFVVPATKTYCGRCGGENCTHETGECRCADCGADAWETHGGWLTPTVLSLAEAAYEDERLGWCCEACGGSGEDQRESTSGDCQHCTGAGRVGDGQLDPFRLFLLADALEEAGCDQPALLADLRRERPRYRDYAPLDAILGKL
jgi:hypothetical protein